MSCIILNSVWVFLILVLVAVLHKAIYVLAKLLIDKDLMGRA